MSPRYFINGLPIYGAGEPAQDFYETTPGYNPDRDPFCKRWSPSEPASGVAVLGPAPPAETRYLASTPPAGTGTKKIQLCVYWLRRLLENGPVGVVEAEAMAVKEGFNERMVRRARDAIHLKPVRRDQKWYLQADSLQSEDRIEAKRLKKQEKVERRKIFRATIKKEKEFRRAAKLFNIPIK
jgi:hypothetical protein